MVINHIGAIRKQLDKVEADLDRLRSEYVQMQDAGFALGNYLLALSRGAKEPTKTEAAKIRTAIALFRCR